MWNRDHGIGFVVAVLILGAAVFGLIGGTSAYFFSRQVTGPHGLSTWHCNLWLQTTQADFQTDAAVNVSTSASPGNVTLGNQTITVVQTASPFVYGMSGNNGKSFSMYNVSNNTWVPLADLTYSASSGGGLTTGDAGNLYAFDDPGQSNNKFVNYSIPGNSWNTLNSPGGKYGPGVTLTNNGTRFLFSLLGNNFTTFERYTISSNSWDPMTSAPGPVYTGAALAYAGNGNIFAFNGSGTTTFWMYNTLTNVWSTNTSAPGRVGAGGALAYAGDGNIYAFNGSGTTTFWRYNPTTQVWSTMASAPGAVNAGGSLVYTSVNGNISAFQGGVSQAFWQYNITSNKWSTFANVPVAVGIAGSLAYPPSSTSSQSVFVPYGNLSSVVNNSGKSGATWSPLIWTNTTNPSSSVANITFQVRASDSSFTATDTSLPWINVSWPSPVTNGLPTGQYFQWRANLTTSNNQQTPVLMDVSLCYS